MKHVLAIAQRELLSMFSTPVAYVFIAVYIFFAGFFFFASFGGFLIQLQQLQAFGMQQYLERMYGEGGYTVWGKLLPAATSQAIGGLPLGLAHDVKLLRPVRQGQTLSWDDVAIDTGTRAYATRREMERLFGNHAPAAPARAAAAHAVDAAVPAR